MSQKKLIVNADDFGQSNGINAGIIKTYEQGIVTSTSLMVRYPAVHDAARYAKKNPSLGVGLHIDLGEWIYANGEWPALYEVVSLNNINSVVEEINKQLESFYRIMNRKPTHIDSHQHVHQREYLLPIFTELAEKLDISLRHYNPAVKYSGNFYGQMEDGSANHNSISVAGLQEIISTLPAGITELACHPGLDDDLETMYRGERKMEVDTLCNTAIRQTIAEANIKLCSFVGVGF